MAEQRTADERKKPDGNTKITCAVCGMPTTYKDFDEHEKTKIHKFYYQKVKQKTRKERKRRAKDNKRKKVEKPEIHIKQGSTIPVITSTPSQQEIYKRDRYYIRPGETLPPHHVAYINTLTALWALRYSFNNYNKNFKISLMDSKWKEFGDIVFEVGNNQEITEIQAVQCKQIQCRNSILLSTLAAELGKFSLKTRCEILKKMQKKADFVKTSFTLYTVSSLTINKETFSSFVYDDKTLETWKHERDKNVWKNRSFIIPEYTKPHILNTTDEPTDICMFRIANHSDPDLDNILEQFLMFTNQTKMEGLKHLIRKTLRNKFADCKDISDGITKHIDDYFKVNIKNIAHYKMTKKDFILKAVELLLEPYLAFPEHVIDEKGLDLWIQAVLSFDVVVLKDHSQILTKIYKGINHLLMKETGCNLDNFPNVTVKNDKIARTVLCSEIFDVTDCHTRDLLLKDLYLALWKTKQIPLVLSVDNANDFSLIGKVAEFLKEEMVDVKFIILATNSEIDYKIFPTSLNIFSNLSNLRTTAPQLFQEVVRSIEIDILDFKVTLENIVEFNNNFLEKVTPDALLNMLLNEFSFNDEYVPITEEIVENTLVLKDDSIQRISRYLQEKNSELETESLNLSYTVNMNGEPTHIHVPPYF